MQANRKPSDQDVAMQFCQLDNPVTNAALFQKETMMGLDSELYSKGYIALSRAGSLGSQRMIDICNNMKRLVDTITQNKGKNNVVA